MEHNPQSHSEPTLVFDSFDIDLVVKVLSHTAFSKSRHSSLIKYPDAGPSGPFFLFLLPVFFFFQGHKLNDTPILISSLYWVLVSSFCALSPITAYMGRTFPSRVVEMVF